MRSQQGEQHRAHYAIDEEVDIADLSERGLDEILFVLRHGLIG
jgi:hypothetical protein